jgi:hypothetical protein
MFSRYPRAAWLTPEIKRSFGTATFDRPVVPAATPEDAWLHGATNKKPDRLTSLRRMFTVQPRRNYFFGQTLVIRQSNQVT